MPMTLTFARCAACWPRVGDARCCSPCWPAAAPRPRTRRRSGAPRSCTPRPRTRPRRATTTAPSSCSNASKAAPPAPCSRSRRSSSSPTCYCKTGEKAQALATLDRFIKLHPSSPALDYALYLRGLVNFNDNLGFLGSLSRPGPVRARPAGVARLVPVVQAAGRAVPEVDATPTTRACAWTTSSTRWPRTRCTSRATTSAAAPTWPRPTARSRRCTEFQQTPSAAGSARTSWSQSYDKLGLTQLRDDAERVLRQELPRQHDPDANGIRQRSSEAVVAALVARSSRRGSVRQRRRASVASHCQRFGLASRQRRHRRQRLRAGAGRSSCRAMRGSQTTSRPRSVSLRISRPAPCFSDTAASATK